MLLSELIANLKHEQVENGDTEVQLVDVNYSFDPCDITRIQLDHEYLRMRGVKRVLVVGEL